MCLKYELFFRILYFKLIGNFVSPFGMDRAQLEIYNTPQEMLRAMRNFFFLFPLYDNLVLN